MVVSLFEMFIELFEEIDGSIGHTAPTLSTERLDDTPVLLLEPSPPTLFPVILRI
jgi:hypothetical protein